MTSEDLRQIIKRGETSLVQFKEMFSASAKIADEMIAFAKEFNIDSQIIGHVEASEQKRLTIKSGCGVFEY